MSRERQPAGWPGGVITFIQRNLPGDGTEDGWDHRHITAYQIGCEALTALGQAVETGRGARLLTRPRLPDVLPRWDDICVAVLKLGRQQDLLSYRLPDGREAPEHAAWFGREARTPPPSNIAPAFGLGPAHAAAELAPVLQALGLIEFGRWTETAELVLWREQPDEWGMEIASDLRFRLAVDQAVTTMPPDIHAELLRLVTITEDDLARSLGRRRARRAEEVAGNGPVLISHEPLTLDSVWRGQIFFRRSVLDWLFFTRWRMPDGWFTPEEQPRALEIFHDPLAIMMRRKVIARLWPDQPWMAE